MNYIAKGINLIEAYTNDKAVQRQTNRTNYPKDPGIKADGGKESIWSKAKRVGSKYTKNIKDSVKSMGGFKPGIPNRILGPAGGLLSYNSNYHNALAQGKEGAAAHMYAAEDTALDIAIGAAIAVAAAGIVALAAPIIGAGVLAGTITVGVAILGGILVNAKFGKENKSIADRIKGGYRKIKGWFGGRK